MHTLIHILRPPSSSLVPPQSTLSYMNSLYWPHILTTLLAVGLPIKTLVKKKLSCPHGSRKALTKNNPLHINKLISLNPVLSTLCSLTNVKSLQTNIVIHPPTCFFYFCGKPGLNLMNTASSPKHVSLTIT